MDISLPDNGAQILTTAQGLELLHLMSAYYSGSGNSTLSSDTNRNIEAGLQHETRVYDLHLVAYQNNVQNLIQWQPKTCDINGLWGPANYGLVQIRGVSLGGNARLGNYTLKASFDILSAIDQKNKFRFT
nr:TonB-dependent receptor [Polynucleobacter necessarius]